ncbi:MAG: hypothetical protein JNK47_23260 [Mesorhizobium sp.]|nr:hypothetical protein [Mesorhizobium sp.]MBL8580129.1 hypothetical protein [Mesorhizobium sp.]
MADEQRFPVYRLISGHIACQQRPGDRWQVVDDGLVDTMLEAFDGVALRPGMIMSIFVPASETDSARKPKQTVAP